MPSTDLIEIRGEKPTMADPIRRRRLGAATITVINVGDLQVRLEEWIDTSPDRLPPAHAAAFGRPLHLPVQCIHIDLPGISLLVDAGRYDMTPGSPRANPQDALPQDLAASLAAAGIPPEGVTTVIITHGHHDHFSGATEVQDGQTVPRFPNAQHYFGRADWESTGLRNAMADTNSMESQTLGLLHRQGLLELIEGDRDLGNGVRIIAAPGETSGHQIVRIHSDGSTLYCVGDLYHHPVEVDQPDCMVRWADPATNLASRRALAQTSPAENALLVATHIPAIGRLQQVADGVKWVEA